MQIVPVETKKHIHLFLNLPSKIHRNNPTYIRPLNKDVEFVFNRQKNKYFRHGECQRWILFNEQGEVIGRVAAFVNDKHIKQHPSTGGMGFFECINDKKATFKLLDTCKEWLKEKGMKAMDGPINFGEKDKFWGITIKNFEQPPYYGQNYTPAYYLPFFEEYGFQMYYKQLIYHRNVADKVQDKFQERAERLLSDPEYTVEFIRKKNLSKYTEDFRTIYNRAWGKREGDNFKGMSKTQAESIMKSMKPVLDEKLCNYAYHKGKPIGFFIGLPELNSIFKKFNGKFGVIQKLRFIFLLKTGHIKTFFGLAFGIDPDYQGKGVEGMLFKACGEKVQTPLRYTDVIITWLGDFNTKMIKIIEGLGGKVIQEMATMRCPFDPNVKVETHKINP